MYSLLEISSVDYEIKIFKLILDLLSEKCTSDLILLAILLVKLSALMSSLVILFWYCC